MKKASGIPITTLRPNPASVSSSVTQLWASRALQFLTIEAQMLLGAGRTKTGILPRSTASSQTNKRATSAISTANRSRMSDRAASNERQFMRVDAPQTHPCARTGVEYDAYTARIAVHREARNGARVRAQLG